MLISIEIMLLAITFLILVSSLSFDDILGQTYAIIYLAIIVLIVLGSIFSVFFGKIRHCWSNNVEFESLVEVKIRSFILFIFIGLCLIYVYHTQDTNTLYAESPERTGKDLAEFLQNEKEEIMSIRKAGQEAGALDSKVTLNQTTIKEHPGFVKILVKFATSNQGREMSGLDLFTKGIDKKNLHDTTVIGSIDKIPFSRVAISKNLIDSLKSFK